MEEVKGLLLKEAKRRYPKNIKFFSFRSSQSMVSTGDFMYYTDTEIYCGGCKCYTSAGKWAEIVKEEKEYWGVNLQNWEIPQSKLPVDDPRVTNKLWKWFDTEEERDAYIHENKPIFSRSKIKALLDSQGDEI